MRLIGQKHSEYNGKFYFKHWVVIPNKIIEKLDWKTGDELEIEVKGGKLIIEKY